VIEEDPEFYEPERKPLARGTRCIHHPDRETVTACEECGRPVCDQCAPLKGGGHAFCKDCLAASRLVDAEPKTIGAPAAEEPAAAAGRGAGRPVVAVLAMLALALLVAALVVFWRRSAG
jgi:hypothetical protein